MDVGDHDRDERERIDAGAAELLDGLPPQSSSTAPSGAATTIDVVSRTADGIEPEVPRNAKCVSAISGWRARRGRRPDSC
jgi:hypothetical protein